MMRWLPVALVGVGIALVNFTLINLISATMAYRFETAMAICWVRSSGMWTDLLMTIYSQTRGQPAQSRAFGPDAQATTLWALFVQTAKICWLE